MKRKLLTLLLCGTLAFGLVACGGTSTDGDSPDGGGSANVPQSSADASQAPKTDDVAVTIEEGTVLLDRDGLVITAKELEDDSIWGLGIKVLIENSTEQNLGIQCNSLIVNNYMISDLFSASVAAGKKSNETIRLSSSGLEAAGIDTLSDIVLSFRVYNSDSYDTLFNTEEIELKTSAYGTVDQPAMDDGQELLNQDGIRIIGKYVDKESFWGAGVLLFVENNHGSNIVVQCENLSINGFMVSPYFSCTVNDGRMALDDITIMSSDLEENDITTVEDIEVSFKILDPDTYKTILQTEPIAFSVA